MFVIPLLKGPPCQTSVMFCAILGGDTSYINHIVLLAFWCGQGAGEGPILAVAAFYLLGVSLTQQLHVVLAHQAAHVRHTLVSYFDSISVQNFSEGVVLWEGSVNYS